jgi:hypothetical protein
VTGRPNSTVIMAAFCHPRPGGGRFNDDKRGAWYSSLGLQTAQREVAYRRWQELVEIGVSAARLQMRDYVADFNTSFHDIRGEDDAFAPLYRPDNYEASQKFALALFAAGGPLWQREGDRS